MKDIIMNKEQEEKFDKWIGREIIFSTHPRDVAHEGWQACLEANGIGEDFEAHFKENFPKLYEHLKSAIPDGYFKIGEEVEFLPITSEGWKTGHIGLIVPGEPEMSFSKIRRIPAWKPKDGEAVLFRSPYGRTCAGVYSCPNGVSGWISYSTKVQDAVDLEMRPYNAALVDTPWDCENEV